MPRSPLVDPCVMPACLAGQACVITHPRVTRRWSAGDPPMPVDHGRTAANRPDRAIGTPRQNPPARVMSPAGTAGTLGARHNGEARAGGCPGGTAAVGEGLREGRGTEFADRARRPTGGTFRRDEVPAPDVASHAGQQARTAPPAGGGR